MQLMYLGHFLLQAVPPSGTVLGGPSLTMSVLLISVATSNQFYSGPIDESCTSTEHGLSLGGQTGMRLEKTI